ncbi:hypothetical protein ABH925_001184 [Streptacidiphilus sp. EB129]
MTTHPWPVICICVWLIAGLYGLLTAPLYRPRERGNQ